ncbi:MAG: aminoacyl-tRNA hydrolase, partial [Alphaproteobacteria bacterium]|nr:aminoacyl-tRNA hydrolase [Alphaproteobacteria bacterium]
VDMQENKPFLIVGLGNPGNEYERTRHNVGFMAVQYLAGADAKWKSEHFAKTYRTVIDGRRVIFAMPQTFMNDSGRAVVSLAAFYKIPIENITVIHDDMDLRLGDMRTKIGGGSAGHNGIKSIDAAIGREYRRIRIGIEHPRDSGLLMSPADWVLGNFNDAQIQEIENVIQKIKIFD